MRLQPRAERGRGDPVAVGQHRGPAPGAQQPVQPVLDHQRHHLRQLPLLPEHRIADPLLAAIETMPAPAARRNMVNVIIDPPGRDHLPGLALMPWLPTALLTTLLLRALPLPRATLLTSQRRIIRRRQRTVRRITLQQTIVLIDPL